MGEERRKSLAKAAIVAAEPRCIYCASPAATVEHMPPRGMFKDKQRPGMMEFGACAACNDGTRGADAVAAMFARIAPFHNESSWQTKEARDLIRAVVAHAPGVIEEIFHPDKERVEWIPGPHGFRKVVKIAADGPRVRANVSVFSAKLAMALYRHHIGFALPLTGAVWCQFALSGGMSQEHLDQRVEKLPIAGTLRQGRKHVSDQFLYRYNTDERTVVAAVAEFHRAFWITLFASSDQRIIDLFSGETNPLPASVFVRPGELLGLL